MTSNCIKSIICNSKPDQNEHLWLQTVCELCTHLTRPRRDYCPRETITENNKISHFMNDAFQLHASNVSIKYELNSRNRFFRASRSTPVTVIAEHENEKLCPICLSVGWLQKGLGCLLGCRTFNKHTQTDRQKSCALHFGARLDSIWLQYKSKSTLNCYFLC